MHQMALLIRLVMPETTHRALLALGLPGIDVDVTLVIQGGEKLVAALD